tara:strand:+ start:4951 stop:7167 length:2217 start_codon:yes stop_codon:yes gene_type:complete
MKKLFVIINLFLFPIFLFSQKSDLSIRPSLIATILESDPIIDGNVLSDKVWVNISPITKMIQTKPLFGVESSEKTEIRIAFSNSILYLGVVCYDSSPNTLVVSDSRRDANLDDDDSFLFIIDTYNDQQNGFLFGTNSAGMEYDAQIDNEGVGNRTAQRQQGGVIGGTNLNWDASWIVKTEVGDYGWSAEFAIPLKSLRFSPGENKSWGINFQRNISKSNEIAFWAPLPLGFNFGIKRVSLAGKMNGISLKKPGNLKFLPYGLTQFTNNTVDNKISSSIDFGADIKFSVTPSLTLDLTYNTDFAQAEVDKQQVNLDRFNLFYPEKRAFFLENAGQFSVGSPGEIDIFFSRRIGISDNGSVVPILAGGRLSGKVGSTNIGLLSMVTDDIESLDINKNSFYVARVNHNFTNSRSSIGAALVGKSELNNSESLGKSDYNNVFAVDGVWGIGKKAKISGFMSKSSTPGIESNDHAFKFSANYDWNSWNIYAQYSEVGDGFNPEVGYLERASFKKPSYLIFKTIRVAEDRKLLEYRPHISGRYYFDTKGNIVTTYTHIDTHWVWKSGLEIHTGYNIRKEWVSEGFYISNLLINSGEYNNSEAQLVFMTNKTQKLSLSTRSNFGGYFGGSKISNSANLNYRYGDKFSSTLSINSNNIKMENEKLNVLISGLGLTYSFSPRIFIQSLIQYNNVENLLSVNTRFGLLNDANTGLFVVFNILKDNDKIDNLNSQQVTLKYTHSFDLIN